VKKYQIIYADPPWKFQNFNDMTAQRWVGQYYPLLDLDILGKLPISNLADKNCALFLWATFPFLPYCLSTLEKWGFQYKTVAFTWVKIRKDGLPLMGMGYWTRGNAEVCLLGTKGHPLRINRSVPQIILAPRQEHSKKPNIVRERIVELLGDLPRIELFARQKVEGWDCWGNEVESDIDLMELR
jgi:N6-adenosine-specific RNA methylase IME4